jgi:KinB signaling pathway activation protein
MAKPLRWYLRLLAGLTIVSCLGQLGLPAELGAASAWGVAPGWQREIAFWDLAMYLMIARTLRANDAVGGRTVAIALVLLQLLVATNHGAAAIQSHAMLNAIMCAVNYGCVVFGTLALRDVRAGGHVPPTGPSA